MEKQMNLSFRKNKKKEIVPDIKVIRNTYMSAGGMIKELVIRKTWFYPTIVTV